MSVTAPSKYAKGKVNMKCVYLGNCQIGKQSCPGHFIPMAISFVGKWGNWPRIDRSREPKIPRFREYIHISNYDKNRQRLNEMCLIFSHLSNYTKMEKCMVGAKGQCG